MLNHHVGHVALFATFVNMSCDLRNLVSVRVCVNAAMTAGERIKQLREERQVTQEGLGKAVGRTKSAVSRIETGETSLDLLLAKRIAEFFDVSLAYVLDIEMGETDAANEVAGFGESDVQPYTPYPGDPFAKMAGDNRYLLNAKTDALTSHGIRRGDVLLVDDSADLCAAPPGLSAVIVQYNEDPGRSEHTVELLRQFVPPSLLVTNAGEKNRRPIDMSIEDAHIVGVVVWSGRKHF